MGIRYFMLFPSCFISPKHSVLNSHFLIFKQFSFFFSLYYLIFIKLCNKAHSSLFHCSSQIKSSNGYTDDDSTEVIRARAIKSLATRRHMLMPLELIC